MQRNYRVADIVLLLFLGLFVGFSIGCGQTKGIGENDRRPETSEAQDAESRESGESITVSREEIETRQAMDVEALLQGRFAGVDVRETADGGFRIRIRGSRSLFGNNDPLYVVDGVPIEPMPGSGLLGINPYDIKSIEVLKGNAAAIYGNRGANGVIVIETRGP